jgi:hypothetical protein
MTQVLPQTLSMQLAIYDLLGALFAPSASDLPSISSHSDKLFTQVCAIIRHRFADPGSVAGIAYYTVEADGFHVVATLAQDGKDRVPLRVQGVLNAGQSLKFSTPGVIGVEPATITLERQGEKLVVRSNHQ